MKKVDYIVLAVFIISLIVIAFFWGCRLDPIVTAIAAVIAIASLITMIVQNKKRKELEDGKEQE